jgi:hypothetical protein
MSEEKQWPLDSSLKRKGLDRDAAVPTVDVRIAASLLEYMAPQERDEELGQEPCQ